MVLNGQFLERPTVIPTAGVFLEGLAHRGELRPALLICPPHPSRGSSMDSPVCAELAFAASQHGHPTLRFNYRGAGASGGELQADPQASVDDAAAALALLVENVGHREVVLGGYDFGAQVAVELANRIPDACRGVLCIAPRGEYDWGRLGRLPVPGLICVGERDLLVDQRALASHCQAVGDELALIEEADHVFTTGLPALGHAVVRFLESSLGPALER